MTQKTNKDYQEQEKLIDQLNKEVADLTAGWQRTQADFVNFKKRSAEERLETVKKANADLIYDLLPILDNFQLAAKHVPEDLKENNWVIGVQQIEKQLENILNSLGLSKIKTIGEEFNPEKHEAVEYVQSEQPKDLIVEETVSGYEFDGQILRPAQVIVSRGE